MVAAIVSAGWGTLAGGLRGSGVAAVLLPMGSCRPVVLTQGNNLRHVLYEACSRGNEHVGHVVVLLVAGAVIVGGRYMYAVAPVCGIGHGLTRPLAVAHTPLGSVGSPRLLEVELALSGLCGRPATPHPTLAATVAAIGRSYMYWVLFIDLRAVKLAS
eukprot:scaffold518_cov388-Prasinococcus_capsulatus_cf.AAC.37